METMFYVAHRDLERPISIVRHVSALSGSSEKFTDPSREYEVHVLDEAGRSAAICFLSRDVLRSGFSFQGVPKEVIAALSHLPSGSAMVVNASGEEVPGF